MSTEYIALASRSELEREDFKTRTWAHFAALLELRLAALREENDNRLDDVKTATIRGRIAEIKALLALPQLAASPAASDAGNAFSAFPAPTARMGARN